MYTDLVMDHFNNPHNVGELEDADGIGEIGSPECGDVIRITIAVGDDDCLTDVRFKTFGCAAAVACSSMVTDLAIGKTLTEAAGITNDEVADALGLPPEKRHCSNLAADGLHLALRDHLMKEGRAAEAESLLPSLP